MDKVLVIVGATGSGKTNLAIKLAKEFNGEVINADAFQIYKEIGIGTAKTTPEEMDGIKFHLNGEISIYDPWDIKIFQDEAKIIIANIIKKGKLPILVGGSNLYIDALIYNYDLSAQPRDDKYEDVEVKKLYSMLVKKDATIAKTIDQNNKRRIIRALQILESGGAFRKKDSPIYDAIFIYSYMEKPELDKKVNANVDKMYKNGWKQEVEAILKQDKNIDKLNALRAIGYLEIIDAIKNNKEIELDLIKQKTRQYAKRQITWIRTHYKEPILFTQNNYQEISKLLRNKLSA